MKESDYLNPNDIKSQCDQAIHKLENDNETLDIVSNSITAFSTDNEIQSISFDNLKQQLADYITVIEAIKSANTYDIAEFSTLKDLVGDEVLDGANILSQMKTALHNKEFYLEKADEYEIKKQTSNFVTDLYYSYVPDNEMSFQPIWKLDGKKEISAMEFDALKGILGFSLEEIPKEDIYTTSGHKILSGELSSTDPNVKAAAGLSALLGLTQFTLSSLSKSEVTVIFQSSEGGNRGTICVGNSEDRATFQNWNYNIPMDTYRDSEPGIGKIWASDYAAGIYKIASGKDVPNPDGTYTITGTLDERHKDTNISGYLSYSADGKLMYTPLTYAGDKAYIESVDGFMEFGRTQILDFSDKLSTPSFADEDSQKLLEELLKGENE